MKIKYLLMIIAALLIIMGGFCMMYEKKKDKITIEDLDTANIKSFYITYSNGYMMNAYTRYQLLVDNEKFIAKIKPYGIYEEDELVIEVNSELMEKISNVLVKYEVNKWNGFDKVDKDVLDGDSFSFSLSLKNDKSLSAHGYMRWPDHFRDVRDEINSMFMEIYNKEKGIKVDESI